MMSLTVLPFSQINIPMYALACDHQAGRQLISICVLARLAKTLFIFK